MSESGQQRGESPLLSDRGATIISDSVVSSIAGMAAQEVEGVHMGGGASRTAGGVLGSLTGSESKTSGISVEVGRTETAIDLKMGIEYNKNILQTVEEVRRRITDRVQSMTGLRIKELNATITDITFPEKEERRRIGSRSATREREASADETASAPAPPAAPHSEPETGASERDTTQVEARSQPESETTPETDTGAEDRREETTELRSGDTRTGEQPEGETSEEARTARKPKHPSRRKRAQRRAEGAAQRSAPGGAGVPKTARTLAVSGMAAALLEGEQDGSDNTFSADNPTLLGPPGDRERRLQGRKTLPRRRGRVGLERDGYKPRSRHTAGRRGESARTRLDGRDPLQRLS
jgi:uncharacterized alkaline shock family protein YloU